MDPSMGTRDYIYNRLQPLFKRLGGEAGQIVLEIQLIGLESVF
jgi:hypothetical protein